MCGKLSDVVNRRVHGEGGRFLACTRMVNIQSAKATVKVAAKVSIRFSAYIHSIFRDFLLHNRYLFVSLRKDFLNFLQKTPQEMEMFRQCSGKEIGPAAESSPFKRTNQFLGLVFLVTTLFDCECFSKTPM